jgi:hypothetical protein
MSKPIIDALLAAGQVHLVEQLRALEPTGPVERLVLAALADGIQRHGPEGARLVGDALTRILDGEAGVPLDLSNLRIASDTLALLERLEADERSAARELVTRVTRAVGPAVSALLGALL